MISPMLKIASCTNMSFTVACHCVGNTLPEEMTCSAIADDFLSTSKNHDFSDSLTLSLSSDPTSL